MQQRHVTITSYWAKKYIKLYFPQKEILPRYRRYLWLHMIKVDILVNMPLDVLEKSIKTREMEGKIVNKNFNDVESIYISQKEVSEVILRTPGPTYNPFQRHL